MFRYQFLSAITLLTVCSCLLAQNQPPNHRFKVKVLGPAKWEPSPQEISVSYWTLEPGWNTELEIRNNVAQRDLTITPVLRISDGQEILLPSVTLASDQGVSINLEKAVNQVNPEVVGRLGSFGSVGFRFAGMSVANIFAASIVHRQGHPIDFHFDGDDSGSDESSAGIEGIWWLPADTSTDYLILSNSWKRPITAKLVLSEPSGRAHAFPVAVNPGQTQRINIREVLGASTSGMGGLSLSVPDGHGSLSATQIVFDEVTGLAAIMKMFERDQADAVKGHLLRAPMMALSHPDPVLAFPDETVLIPRILLRNAGPVPLAVSAIADWRKESDSGRFQLPNLILSPGDTRIMNLEDFQKGGQIPASAAWSTLTLGYNGRRADLVAVALSYDRTRRYGLQTPFSEGTSRLWEGGMWHVDATHNTLMTTGNGGSEPTTAQVTLFYNGGQGKYRIEKPLPAGQQLWLDVGQLIRNQVPDSDGRTLPPDAMFGAYEVRDLDHQTVGSLYEGKLVIDKTFGHASYGCAGCCGYQPPFLLPSPFNGLPGINNQDVVQAMDFCTGQKQDVTSGAYSWSSSNTAVATLSQTGNLHTVSVGSSTGKTFIQLQSQSIHSNCPTDTFNPPQAQSVIDVTITIAFTGSKSSGDNLKFGAASYDCSEGLGVHGCSTVWLWNIEGQGVVSDDASKWTVTQSYTGRAKGYYKDSSGVLHAFDDTLNVPNDSPSSSFLQQPAGQTIIYWLDGPGYNHLYTNGLPVDSITQVQNFTTTFCSIAGGPTCKSKTWYFKLVVNPGAKLDLTNSVAAYGSASTNF